MSTVVRLSEKQVEMLSTYQALRVKQLELLAQGRTDTKAFKSIASELKDKALTEVLSSALEYAIESLECDIDCLSMPAAEVVPEVKPKTKKASK